jgi:tRNA threonylcarbamoyladenosine biosynthesis protein TsaE
MLFAIIAPASPAAFAVSDPRSAVARGSNRARRPAAGAPARFRVEAFIVSLTVPNTVARAMEKPRRSQDPRHTEAIGAELATGLSPGDVVLVAGELGAGKTTLVRGGCRALGVIGIVTSPTFTIGQRYRAPVPVSHVDLFRITNLSDEDPDLLYEYIRPDTISFVEWPSHGEEAVDALGRVVAKVLIEHAGGDERLITINRTSAAA